MMRVKEEILAMESLSKLERKILGWLKDVPHLPVSVRQWLGENIWWIAVIGTVLTGIAVLGLLGSIFNSIGLLNTPAASFYASTTFITWIIINAIVALVFTAIELILLANAIKPLKTKQKKGWVLLFATWLVGVVAMVVSAILTLNPLSFIGNLIFGTIWVALTGYLLFEIHGQFAHVERSKGVKEKKV